MTSTKNLPESYDVIVAGGGPSGSMAALAAAREGCRVLLVEQFGFLGGSLTAMGVGPMMTFHNNSGEQVIQGYPQELIDRLMAKGGSPGHVEDIITYVSTVTPFDSEMLKIELEEMLTEAGVDILYHTMLLDAEVDSGKLKAITIANKAGVSRIEGKVFIDSTGDADLASRAGVPFEFGRDADSLTQPMTMNLKLGNVDRDKLIDYVKNNVDDCEFDYGAELGLKRLETAPRLSLKTFIKALEQARKSGEITFNREFILLFETSEKGTFIINVSRIQGLNATNPLDLSKAEMIGRKQCLEIFNFLKKHGAGFENAIRLDSSSKVGVRESKRVVGRYTLTAEDLLSAREFEDTIALGGYPIDIHSPDENGTNTQFFKPGTTYCIPLRSLQTNEVSNLLVNGRCLSASHEAFAAIRTTPTMMAIGQGAGTAAALMKDSSGQALDLGQLRNALEKNGALLVPPPAPAEA
ncbi:FAD-dependent oxidoreductase [Pelagicoccus sp. NFK12]|uniref:FAD-dependent oxidoreductase n=1 Tax=Pelagicoccus enzymogenes TaxID=2773457 RepID=A0A927IE17_9BACT|nr:FAD-dependent oxidoreductase [Pelagicoccus enzymogenes]MBD5778557.1 FAD-dependent oxidoreductase [Pelagicoccus enzymogenes]